MSSLMGVQRVNRTRRTSAPDEHLFKLDPNCSQMPRQFTHEMLDLMYKLHDLDAQLKKKLFFCSQHYEIVLELLLTLDPT